MAARLVSAGELEAEVGWLRTRVAWPSDTVADASARRRRLASIVARSIHKTAVVCCGLLASAAMRNGKGLRRGALCIAFVQRRQSRLLPPPFPAFREKSKAFEASEKKALLPRSRSSERAHPHTNQS